MKSTTKLRIRNRRRNGSRQGITLLFVISMIVLFLLMGTTFVIVSNDFFRGSRSRSLREVHKLDAKELIERGILDVLRGPDPNDVNSPLRFQSILADQFGFTGFKATIAAASSAVIPETRGGLDRPSNDQLLELQFTTTGADAPTNILTGGALTGFSPTDDFYNGQVLSFTEGPLKGASTRIYDYYIQAGTFRFVIVAPDEFPTGTSAALIGSEVIINGRDFSGSGTGDFQGEPENLPNLAQNALQPNRTGEALLATIGGYMGNPLTDGGKGQPNESYDFPDSQNAFLAGFRNSAVTGFIPSYHRDWTAQYFGSRTALNAGGNVNQHIFSAFDVTPAIVADTAPVALNPPPVDSDHDGVTDAYWMDIGASVQSNGEGLYYKPLYAFMIIDLDSCINLNTAGNHVDMLRVAAGVAAPDFGGSGFGPADISLQGFLTNDDYDNVIQGVNGTTYPGRYGIGLDGIVDSGDEVPGRAGRDNWSTKKLYGYPDGPSAGTPLVGRLFQTSPLDIRGRFSIYTPTASPIVDPNATLLNALFSNALPQIDTTAGTVDDVMAESPYEANFTARNSGRWETNNGFISGDDDTPFTPHELEGLFRPNDADSNTLDARLLNVLGPANRANSTIASFAGNERMVTTDSWEVPVCNQWVVIDASREIEPLSSALAGTWFNLLPPEVQQGRRFNLNRPFGNGIDDNTNGTVDDPQEGLTETNTADAQFSAAMDLNNDFVPGTGDDEARYWYARHLYTLALFVCERNPSTMTSEQYHTAIAQWAVNVVDFCDADSINTRFEFDSDLAIDGTWTEPADLRVVWGCERPELLITEAAAYHDRSNEDLATDASGTGDTTTGSDDDWDSRIVPRSSAFIELYHPWVQSSQHQILPAELGDGTTPTGGVSLQRRTPGGNPVWRIGVVRSNTNDGDAIPNYPNVPDVGGDHFVRVIYFTDLSTTASGVTYTAVPAPEEFYSTLASAVIPPGAHAVIGSSGTSQTGTSPQGYRTTFGRLQGVTDANVMLDDTRSITLFPTNNPNDPQIARHEWDSIAGTMATTTVRGVAVVIDGPRSLSISDPDTGYDMTAPGMMIDDGFAFDVPQDEPLDADTTGSRNAFDLTSIWTNGTTDEFRSLELQRLANPNLNWDATTNPYITIDIAPIDLTAFNGMYLNQRNIVSGGSVDASMERVGGVTNGDTDGRSTERGETATGLQVNQLFAVENGRTAVDRPVFTADGHNLSFLIEETFGRTNDSYNNNPATRYAWLTWNNRPFANQFELANVPFVRQRSLTEKFGVRDLSGRNPFAAASTDIDPPQDQLGHTFPHLLNFDGDTQSSGGNVQGNFYRLFDYVEVPSLYVGTEKWANPADFINAPYNSFSNYRYPGKINFNTAREQVYLQAVGTSFAGNSFADQTPFNTFNSSRWQDVSVTPPGFTTPITVEMPRPFRGYAEGNFVPELNNAANPNALVEEGVDCGFMRRRGTNATPAVPARGLFDVNDTDASRHSDRSAYFRNRMRQRIGSIATTRSSVFAIWITVGFFEVDENGDLKNRNTGGIEMGAETGNAQRHRGFFIFDRSIPMAFEPGKNHNVENGILVKSIIE